MNRFNFLFYMCTIAMIACTPAYASYGGQAGYGGGLGHAGIAGANEAALNGLIQGIGSFNAGQGPVEGDGNGVPTPCDKTSPVQSIPYAVPQRPNTLSSSITYPQNKGEILIHRPAAIIVKRPPTKVVVNHPPLVVKPAPVVLHKPPAVVLRKVYVKHHPRPVKVEPVYVNVVKPPAEKYFVNEKKAAAAPGQFGQNQAGAGQAQAANIDLSASGFASGNAGADSAAANAGYQLLHGNQGFAALAGIAQGNYGGAAPSGYEPAPPSGHAPAPPSGYAPAPPSYVPAPSPY